MSIESVTYVLDSDSGSELDEEDFKDIESIMDNSHDSDEERNEIKKVLEENSDSDNSCVIS